MLSIRPSYFDPIPVFYSGHGEQQAVYLQGGEVDALSGCGLIWDPVQARFGPCASLCIAGIPAVFAVFVALYYVLRPIFSRWRPKWSEPFIVEHVEPAVLEVPVRRARVLSSHTAVLCCVSTLGFAICVVSAYDPVSATTSSFRILFAVPLAVGAFLAAITCPRTVPFPLLLIYGTFLVSQFVLLLNLREAPSMQDFPQGVTLFVAMFAVGIIICMPLRDPNMPSDQIASTSVAPTSRLRTPEDNETLLQFFTVSWMTPMISLGAKRVLKDEDVWGLGYEFLHKLLHSTFRELQGTIVQRLLRANGTDLVFNITLGVIELCANLSTPVLLQQLLRSMEDPAASRSAAATYATLTLIVRLIASQCSVIGLWFSRRCYERSRGEMITMLYEKTLSRKIIGGKDKTEKMKEIKDVPLPDSSSGSKDHSRFHPKIIWSGLRSSYAALRQPSRLSTLERSLGEANKEPASMGKILNLMKNDVYEVSQRFWEAPALITTPLGLVLSMILVWRIVGWPFLLGIIAVVVAQLINVWVSKTIRRWDKVRRGAVDIKLQKVSQFVEAIRHLRWYGWQEAWLETILEARDHELKIRLITSLWRILLRFLNGYSTALFPVVTFYAFTILAGQPLRIDIAFPALQLFNMLQRYIRTIPDLITTWINATVAVKRIEDFMSEPDKENSGTTSIADAQLELKNASFAWPGQPDPVLHDITLNFPPGITLICGPVAAGKSALLQALLGELDWRGGLLVRPDQTVGYCAQTPWLQSMSIRENILFSSPYEEQRFKEVMDACALTSDMAQFKDGDLSEIGENGIGLSGGQRARVALARAVYSEASTLLFDDPLSALDQETAESIVKNCFMGPMMKERTIILVTHRTDLCRDVAQQIVYISEGRAQLSDPSEKTVDTLASVPTLESTGTEDKKKDKAGVGPSKVDMFLEKEKMARGGVRWSVYWEYLKAGKLRFWAILILLTTVSRVVNIFQSWFIKAWGEAYDRPKELQRIDALSNTFDRLPSPENDARPWILVYFLFGTAIAVFFLLVQLAAYTIVFVAARGMFKVVMQKVSHAIFRFYDVTPVGMLMNRLTSDMNTIDGRVSVYFHTFATEVVVWLASLLVIASVTPTFFAFAVGLAACFGLIFRRFLPTSQSLRRLEMVSLTPLMSNFGALLHGLTTVRAFRAQSRFQERVIDVVDTFQRMDHFYWSLQAWLSYRLDALSASSTFLLAIISIYGGLSPGLTAFVLLSASAFVEATHSLCKIYGNLQMDFVSVERITELMHTEQEPKGLLKPPASWPLPSGDIIFEDVTLRYAPHLDPALQNLSFVIKGGSSTAIVGRTGSGKSTMALALLATILPDSGRILIDDIDISKVEKQALRRRVTFLAQDPVLFPGSMRKNLDPLDEYTDEECESVLRRIGERHAWSLTTDVHAGGRNLSQGQRQLVGLARAVLRRSSIVILDEATASIDFETAQKVQQILREEMKESTLIIIAHRFEAVKDADDCLSLAKGRLVGRGRPENIENGEGSGSRSQAGSGTATPAAHGV